MTTRIDSGPFALGGAAASRAERCAEAPGLAQIYTEHFDFVWRCLRRLGVPELALDDAAHDTFVIAHRLLPGFEGRSSVRTWLFSILRKVARDHRRAAQRLASGAPIDTLESRLPSPEESAEDREAARLLSEVLDRLTDEKREAFVLVELEGLSVVEAAEATSTNVNTMHARLRAARRELEAALSEGGAR